MIARHWKALAKPEEAENYISHLKGETFPSLTSIEGFVKAFIFKRSLDTGIEFLIVTIWQSMEAIQQFAGEAAELAVVPEKVRAMMFQYDEKVEHFEIVEDFHG